MSEYSIAAYGGMVLDELRFAPWREALRRHVRPDSVVLDIGCGTGILSFLACQFGARRVFAVEPDVSIEVAKRCATNVPGAERIEWTRGLSTEIDLPEQADIVIGDLHGTLPFFPGNISSLADAHKRHLKPGGKLLPQRDLLYAVPASAPDEQLCINVPWRSNTLGLDLTAALPHVVNAWHRALPKPIPAARLLAKQAHWGTVEYSADEETRTLDNTLTWTIQRDSVVDGLYVWFDGVVDDDLCFSNSPVLPELVYGRGFFPLTQPVAVQAGDTMRTRLSVRLVQDDWIYRWDTTIEGRDGQCKAAFRQSTFQMLPEQLDDLRKSEASHTPVLNQNGQIHRAILEHMDGNRSLADIAHALMQQFPAKFRNYERALATVARVSRRCS